jgi:hypothetical protein
VLLGHEAARRRGPSAWAQVPVGAFAHGILPVTAHCRRTRIRQRACPVAPSTRPRTLQSRRGGVRVQASPPSTYGRCSVGARGTCPRANSTALSLKRATACGRRNRTARWASWSSGTPTRAGRTHSRAPRPGNGPRGCGVRPPMHLDRPVQSRASALAAGSRLCAMR